MKIPVQWYEPSDARYAVLGESGRMVYFRHRFEAMKFAVNVAQGRVGLPWLPKAGVSVTYVHSRLGEDFYVDEKGRERVR